MPLSSYYALRDAANASRGKLGFAAIIGSFVNTYWFADSPKFTILGESMVCNPRDRTIINALPDYKCTSVINEEAINYLPRVVARE